MDIYEALKNDHDELKATLNELISLEAGDEERRHELIRDIRDELVPHSRAEESVFYNSLRSLDAAKDIAMHGYAEHMEAETILRILQAKDKIDLDWKASARKLKDALEHHIQEEETKMFSIARQLFTEEEAEMMADAFEQIKPQVKTEGLMKTTLDMIVNVMPERFQPALRTFSLHPEDTVPRHP